MASKHGSASRACHQAVSAGSSTLWVAKRQWGPQWHEPMKPSHLHGIAALGTHLFVLQCLHRVQIGQHLHLQQPSIYSQLGEQIVTRRQQFQMARALPVQVASSPRVCAFMKAGSIPRTFSVGRFSKSAHSTSPASVAGRRSAWAARQLAIRSTQESPSPASAASGRRLGKRSVDRQAACTAG